MAVKLLMLASIIFNILYSMNLSAWAMEGIKEEVGNHNGGSSRGRYEEWTKEKQAVRGRYVEWTSQEERTEKSDLVQEGNPKEENKPVDSLKDEKANSDDNENAATLFMRAILNEAITKVNTHENVVKLEEIDPILIKTIAMRLLSKFETQDLHKVFVIVPAQITLSLEARPVNKKEKKVLSETEKLQRSLNKQLKEAFSTEENTALISIKKFLINDDQLNWDDSHKFSEDLDKIFFVAPQSCGLKICKGFFAFLEGACAPLPLTGVILVSMGNVFGFLPGGVASKLLAGIIMTTVAPVSIRVVYERLGNIFDKETFINLNQDEALTQKKVNEVINRLIQEKLTSKREGEDQNILIASENNIVKPQFIAITKESKFIKNKNNLSSEELKAITIQAQEEVGEEYRHKPHIFKKSKRHKGAEWGLGFSCAINALVIALLVLDVYQGYDKTTHSAWGYVFAVFVGFYDFLNRLDFGGELLWSIFSHYQYVGSGQSSEESIREKRKILIERIKHFQDAIAEDKAKTFIENVYKNIAGKIKRIYAIGKKQGVILEEDISAFSLLMLKDKIRLTKDDMEAHGALNFQKDLDVIKVSLLDDFLENLTAGIVGAGMLADVEILRFTFQRILEDVFDVDHITAVEFAGFYATAFLDASFKSVTEFKLHQDNLKSWLKTFSIRHLVDFKLLRKTIGFSTTIMALVHAFPKVYIGLKALFSYPMLGKIALLIPSGWSEFSRYQAIFGKHYNGMVTDVATLKMENIGVPRMRAFLKFWSDKALKLIKTYLDDETIDKIYSTFHQGM